MKNRFEKFTYLINSINKKVQRIKVVEMKNFGLKGDHATFLFYLYNNPKGLSQSELAKLSDIDKASVNREIQVLLEKKFVLIEQIDKSKKYNAKILLSEDGKKVALSTIKKIEKAVDIGGKGITNEEREKFYKLIELIDKNLSNYIKGELK